MDNPIVQAYLDGKSLTQIARENGHCCLYIKNILVKNNIYKPPQKPNPINKKEVISLYNQGMNGKNIALRLGIKYTTFIGWAKRNKITLRQREYKTRPKDDIAKLVEINKTNYWYDIDYDKSLRNFAKYHLDSTFFNKIDSEEKAYILGYWYADGNVYKTSLQATSMDLDILQKIKYYLKFSGPIRSKRSSQNNNIYYNIYIRCAEMAKSLINNGCPEKKSLILKFPPTDILPQHLVHHFIRGYFDGDGSIFCSMSKGHPEWAMGFVGTKEFMDGVVEHLNIPVRYNQTRPGRNNWTITFCKSEYLEKVLHYMYKDAHISMNRKTILADQCLQYIYEHKLYKGKINVQL